MIRFLLLFAILPTVVFGVESGIVVNSGQPNFLKAGEAERIVPKPIESNSEKTIPWANSERQFGCDRTRNPDCIDLCKSDSTNGKIGEKPIDAVGYNGANDKYFNPNSNTYDQNAVANFNITNSNQTAFQGYSQSLNGMSTQDMLKQNVTIPFKAGNSTSVNVGASKVEFNISY